MSRYLSIKKVVALLVSFVLLTGMISATGTVAYAKQEINAGTVRHVTGAATELTELREYLDAEAERVLFECSSRAFHTP